MAALEPLIDVYGTYGRACALADWIELAAIAGIRVTVADLSDIIDDNGWASRPARHFKATPADYEQADGTADVSSGDPEDMAQVVFEMLQQRRFVLGPAYPFDYDRGSLRYVAKGYGPYLSLLCVAVAHAWPGIKTAEIPSPEHTLEGIVVTCLQYQGFRAAGLGALDRTGRTFAQNLIDTGKKLALRPTVQPVPIAVYAKDAGVDTLACIPWLDGRRGQWVLMGQVTCARSDAWEEKLDEPKPHRWKKYLLEPLAPLPFLAVPHHVEARHLAYLLESEQGLVIDRLRLAVHDLGVTLEERQIIDAVLAEGVSDGRAARSAVA